MTNGITRVIRMGKYTSVSIPIVLAEEIDRVVESGRYGYKNRPEFVCDAIRRRLEELKPLH
jgi:metal-responsive CopG/Arc/MetJ family transcriptional regulator